MFAVGAPVIVRAVVSNTRPAGTTSHEIVAPVAPPDKLKTIGSIRGAPSHRVGLNSPDSCVIT